MNNNTLPDWINVVFAALSFVAFIFVERKSFHPRNRQNSNTSVKELKNIPRSQEQIILSENDISIRSKIYSRVLIGIIVGLAFPPIIAWISHASSHTADFVYSAQNHTALYYAITTSFIIGSFFSMIAINRYNYFSHFFVNWIERIVIAFAGYFINFWFFSHWTQYNQSSYYFLKPNVLYTIIINILIFTIISFPSTPIDWLIHSIRIRKQGSEQ